MHGEVVLVVAGVLAGGVFAQWFGWRLRVPAIVFLLGGGLLAGPITGALDPDHTFGELLFPAISIAVAVILFEGALGLGWRGVRAAGRTVWLLLSVGAAVTLAGSAVTARFVLDVDWRLAVLLASVLVVTGPTVIGPIVRSIGLHGRVGAILEAEGTLIDPIGAILTVLLFQAMYESGDGTSAILGDLLLTLAVGAALGLVGAALLVTAFSRYVLPDQLHNITTLATVVGAFALADALQQEAGLVAVTVMGIAVAGQRRVSVQHVLEFNETLRIVFISGLFVLLGARIDAETLRQFEWRNVAFLVILVGLVRPVGALLSTLGSRLARSERAFLALTAPRGIVAASVASIFSLRLSELRVANSQILVSATFTVIAGTVLLSGFGSRPLARRLGLVDGGRKTMVVLGANPVAQAFAAALERAHAPVSLVDLDRSNLSSARLTGLHVHHGSVFADDTWEQVGLQDAACFIAMTRNDELNAMASRHAAVALGRRQVFQLPPKRPEHEAWWTLPTGTFARPLFARDTNHTQLAERLAQGWKITGTPITAQFDADAHARTHPGALPLFIVGAKGNVDLCAADARRRARPGETLYALTPEHAPSEKPEPGAEPVAPAS